MLFFLLIFQTAYRLSRRKLCSRCPSTSLTLTAVYSWQCFSSCARLVVSSSTPCDQPILTSHHRQWLSKYSKHGNVSMAAVRADHAHTYTQFWPRTWASNMWRINSNMSCCKVSDHETLPTALFLFDTAQAQDGLQVNEQKHVELCHCSRRCDCTISRYVEKCGLA